MFRNPTADAIVVLVIVLLIFGPKRLPGLGRSLGQGMREFKDSITGNSKDEDGEERQGLPEATAPPTATGSPTAAGSPTASERPSAEVGSTERQP